jgi:hypothetical protein
MRTDLRNLNVTITTINGNVDSQGVPSALSQAQIRRTSPDSCAKRADLIQWLIVDFVCTEPVLREIASEEKSVIERVNESVNNLSKSRRASKGLRESVHDSNEAFRHGKAEEWIA